MQSDHRTEVKSPEENENSSNKRIAKNAVMLYLRMFLTMIVGFYTSRVVLDTLGVEDYGIYGIVGGVVAMVGFLNASMSGATSRFLTFELGRGNPKRLAKTFSSALIVHVGIALVVFVLAETVGLWFLANKLVIPPERMGAAHWVYQLSIVSTMLGITQVPYNATIIAHEKMDVYAYVEILSVTLKLLIVYLLTIGNFDKLILYATLVFAVGVLILIIYRLYCIRHFPESHFHWVWDKTILKPLIVYSSWNLYGSICVTIRQQGLNFLINIFFGVVFNAAASVASNVQGIVKGFTYNSMLAFRPQIIKNYAQGNFDGMLKLMKVSFSIAVFLTLLLSLPIFLEIDFLLSIWLVKPPFMTNVFIRLLLISSLFAMMTGVFTIGIEATGKNKRVNVYTGTLYMLTIPAIYVFYSFGCEVVFAYYCIVGANILIFISNMLILKHLNPGIQLTDYLLYLLKTVIVVIVAIASASYVRNLFHHEVSRFFVSASLSLAIYVLLSYFIVLDHDSRNVLRNKAKQLLAKFT